MEVFTNVSKKSLENVLKSVNASQKAHERLIWRRLNSEAV